MIKWAELRDGDVLYEVFLPEHESEACDSLLRASSRGHILGERRLSLTWPPRFGPDVDDMAATERMAEKLAVELDSTPRPEGEGTYRAGPIDLPPVEPILLAFSYALVEQFVQAEASLGLSEAQTAAYLHLPVTAGASGLYPYAVTAERDARMRKLIALDVMLKRHPALQTVQADVLNAVLTSDQSTLLELLAKAGLDEGHH